MTMNLTPDHLDDELLSVLLDGDAAGGSAEAAVVDAAAHLRACDRCSSRQRELAGARTALAAASVGPVDELTRRRLVAAALTAAAEERASAEPAAPARTGRSRWLARHPALLGSAAAVVLGLLVGVPFVIGDDNPSGEAGTSLAAGAPEGALESAASFLGDLGDLSDRANLRLRLTTSPGSDTYAYAPMEPGASPAAGGSTAAPVPSAAPAAGGLASTTTVAGYQSAPMAASRNSGAGAEKAPAADTAADAATSNPQSPPSDQAADRDRADTDACVAALLNGPARNGRLAASGTGSFEGRPAIVAVFELSGGRVAFVADRDSCAVRDRFAV